jgi:hypothetical protein
MYIPSPREAQLIAASKTPRLTEALIRWGASYNLLDYSVMDPLLAETCTYHSQSVEQVLTGKPEVAAYFRVKFDTLRHAGEDALVRLELATHPALDDPCLIVHQRTNRFGSRGFGERVAVITMVLDDEAVTRVAMITSIPPPAHAEGSGVFPGLTAAAVQRDGEYRGRLLHKQAELEFILVSVEDVADWNEVVWEVIVRFASALQNATVRRIDAREEQQELSVWGLRSFPSIVIRSAGHVAACIQVSGKDPGDLLEELKDLFANE